MMSSNWSKIVVLVEMMVVSVFCTSHMICLIFLQCVCFKCVSNVFKCISNVCKCISNVFKSVSNVFQMCSNVLVEMCFKCVSNVFKCVG